VKGPGKWSAPGPVLALGGPAFETEINMDICRARHNRHIRRPPDYGLAFLALLEINRAIC